MSAVLDKFMFQQFSQISIGSVVYEEGDAVIINGLNGEEVAILNYIYGSNGEILLNVIKYIWANNLKKLFKKHVLDFDKNYEVVQDLTRCYDISLKQIIRKCTLVILTSADIVHYVEKHFPGSSDHFSCRLHLKENRLHPLLPESTSLDNNLLNTPIKTVHQIKNNSINSKEIPMAATKNIEIHLENDYFSPMQRNQVKRDLNKSFGNSPPKQDKSILIYSIDSLSDDETDEKLIRKNNGSRKRNALNTENNVSSPPKLRKSTRSVTRKSYADYVSPRKMTPSKRRLTIISSYLEDSDWDSRNNRVANSTLKEAKNLKKDSNMNTTPSKKRNRISQCYTDDLNSMYERTLRGTPARRSLKLTKAHENDSLVNIVRNYKKPASNQEENIGVTGVSGDDLRANLLKSTFKKLELDENDRNFINVKSDSEIDDDDSKKTNLDDSFNTKIVINLENLNLSDRNNGYSGSTSESECGSTPKKRKPTKPRPTPCCTPKGSKNTPKTPKSTITSKAKPTPKTPKNRAKLIRDGFVTPSMQERSKKIKGGATPLTKARSQLHVSYVPASLPCREKEYCDIYNFVEAKLVDGCGGCMYISGVPGTGKTATVTSVISQLQISKNIPKFTFVNVNGMRLTEPRQAYVEILKQVKGKTVSWEQAQNSLEEMFVKVKKTEPIVMLIDELDILCTRRQDVVYNLLDWPTKAKNQLVVISIANTMDLPERLLMNRVTSRLGLTRLTFQAYSFKQLQEIVVKRLSGTDSFNPDAIQFVARKVASVSGDARRALDICRRAAEIAESEGKTQLVNMNHVNEALSAMITQPKVLAIKNCSTLEQLILQSIVAEVERTGVEETTFCDVYKMLITCAAIEGFKIVSSTVAQRSITKLSACRLILAEQKCNNIFQKIILNVSIDDVYYALQKNRS